MLEIKEGIKTDKIVFGVKQTLKNSKSLNKVIVSSDCREEIIQLLNKNKLDVEVLDVGKDDIAIALEMDFKSEVFGLRK